jgi:hypothetical protein
MQTDFFNHFIFTKMRLTLGSSRIGFPLFRQQISSPIEAFVGTQKQRHLEDYFPDKKEQFIIQEVEDDENSDPMVVAPWKRFLARFLGVTSMISLLLAGVVARVQIRMLRSHIYKSESPISMWRQAMCWSVVALPLLMSCEFSLASTFTWSKIME